MVHSGLLDKKTLKRMSEALDLNSDLKTHDQGARVVLDKDIKTSVSLSIRRRVLRKIDKLAALSGTSRSEAVEKLVELKIDEIINEMKK
ncbi:ribbon-helix-helix protein, CopG family, partial [Klebsiella pneumoniae]|nr:ribbon-helix-helix protein, CopG family [Klebsiella pneumoniae]EKW3041967.1 ribbon-helix-helix protein, CopG family [Klebsiella pneumoniae]EKW4484484.1 ribbon-helix-helix protein, CopG family [Klebsiella pneumoniae]EKW5868187.1 ribbon-helix-helix protein, CopG family [Klebsiella pneumoniae]